MQDLGVSEHRECDACETFDFPTLQFRTRWTVIRFRSTSSTRLKTRRVSGRVMREIACENAPQAFRFRVVYPLEVCQVPSQSSCRLLCTRKRHFHICPREKWLDWRNKSRSRETEGLIRKKSRAISAAKSTYFIEVHREREVPGLAGGGCSHERTSLRREQGKIQGKLHTVGEFLGAARPELSR